MFGKVASSLRTFSLVKGLPVYEQETGKMLGKVSDLCFTNTGKIEGLIMECKKFFERCRYIPMSAITAIGTDGVIVAVSSAIQHVNLSEQSYSLYTHRGIAGKPVITSKGEKLGLLDDVYFHEHLGTIEGYEITEGFFADVTEGKKRIQTVPLTVGEEAIIVNTIV
jgi:uncharacterized protein YrrD